MKLHSPLFSLMTMAVVAIAGYPTDPPPPVKNTTYGKCRSCGKNRSPESGYCPRCGAR